MRNQRWIVPQRDGKHHPDLRLDVTDEAIFYDRFSTPPQGERDSGRRQKSRNELAAEHHGLRPRPDRASDHGVSGFRGKNFERGALGALKRAFENGTIPRYTKVITETIDRITRASEFDATNTFQALLGAGMIIVTADDMQVWSADNMGRDGRRHVLASKIATANQESRGKSERVGEHWEQAQRDVADGKRNVITKICPGWLRADAENDFHEIIPDLVLSRTRAGWVEQIFRWRLGTDDEPPVGKDVIAQRLNRLGVPPFTRELQGLADKRAATAWQPAAVGKLLANEAIVGVWQGYYWNEREVDGKWIRERVKSQFRRDGVYPAVVEPAIFYAVRKLLERDTKRPRRGGPNRKVVRNLFTGIAKCGRCGSPLICRTVGHSRPRAATRRKPVGLLRTVLVCDAWARSKTVCGKPVCERRERYPVAPIEMAIKTGLGWLVPLEDAPSDDPQIRAKENRLALLTAQVKRDEAAVPEQMKRLFDAPAAVRPIYEKALEKLAVEAAKNAQERDALLADLPALKEARRLAARQKGLADLITKLEAPDPDERAEARMAARALLRGVLEEVVSEGDGVVVVRATPGGAGARVREFKVGAEGIIMSSVRIEKEGRMFALSDLPEPDPTAAYYRDPMDVMAKVLARASAPKQAAE